MPTPLPCNKQRVKRANIYICIEGVWVTPGESFCWLDTKKKLVVFYLLDIRF